MVKLILINQLPMALAARTWPRFWCIMLPIASNHLPMLVWFLKSWKAVQPSMLLRTPYTEISARFGCSPPKKGVPFFWTAFIHLLAASYKARRASSMWCLSRKYKKCRCVTMLHHTWYLFIFYNKRYYSG